MPTLSQHTFRLYKREKLCSETAIDLLFSRTGGGQAALFYPLRVVWRNNPKRQSEVAQFLISVPKKRLRHAVDRVAMRRLIREAYRLNRSQLGQSATMPVDIAFTYVADKRVDFNHITSAMIKALRRIAKSCSGNTAQNFVTDNDDNEAKESIRQQ